MSSETPPSDARRGSRAFGRRPVRRDVSTVPTALIVVGLTFGAYLLAAVACAPATSPTGDDPSCYDRVVYHASRLTDC